MRTQCLLIEKSMSVPGKWQFGRHNVSFQSNSNDLLAQFTAVYFSFLQFFCLTASSPSLSFSHVLVKCLINLFHALSWDYLPVLGRRKRGKFCPLGHSTKFPWGLNLTVIHQHTCMLFAELHFMTLLMTFCFKRRCHTLLRCSHIICCFLLHFLSLWCIICCLLV